MCPACMAISSAAQCSRVAARRVRCWRACWATTYRAEPPTTVPRVDPVPPPDGTTAVSPCSTHTSAGVIRQLQGPIQRQRIIARVVGQARRRLIREGLGWDEVLPAYLRRVQV